MSQRVQGKHHPGSNDESAGIHSEDEPVSVQYCVHHPAGMVQDHCCKRCGIKFLQQSRLAVTHAPLQLLCLKLPNTHPEPAFFSHIEDFFHWDETSANREYTAESRRDGRHAELIAIHHAARSCKLSGERAGPPEASHGPASNTPTDLRPHPDAGRQRSPVFQRSFR